jgi:hypothetical protein
MFGSKATLLVAPLAFVGVLIPATAGGDITSLPQQPTLVKTDRVYPKRVLVIKTRFKPPAYPSPNRVLEIIQQEANRLGVSAAHLRNRISCETGGTFDWRQTNGQYKGVGQFSWSTFERGVRSLDSRVVKYIEKRWRAKRVKIVDIMSDGSTTERWGWRIRQLVVHHYRGKIPRNPPHRHTSAQIRIMAGAMANKSAVNDSEWECR